MHMLRRLCKVVWMYLNNGRRYMLVLLSTSKSVRRATFQFLAFSFQSLFDFCGVCNLLKLYRYQGFFLFFSICSHHPFDDNDIYALECLIVENYDCLAGHIWHSGIHVERMKAVWIQLSSPSPVLPAIEIFLQVTRSIWGKRDPFQLSSYKIVEYFSYFGRRPSSNNSIFIFF